jgi:hypothetical protein
MVFRKEALRSGAIFSLLIVFAGSSNAFAEIAKLVLPTLKHLKLLHKNPQCRFKNSPRPWTSFHEKDSPGPNPGIEH